MDYDFSWFKEKIYELTTINLNKYKTQQMERRITTYIFRRLKLDYKSFYDLIASNEHELDMFVEYLTINVSEFFRNKEQWDILKEEILPTLIGRNKRIKIWSSACSTGEEPYSLAMLLDDVIPSGDYQIIATDLDKCVLQKAKQAIYRLPDFNVIPDKYKKWFDFIGDERYRLKETLINRVEFNQLDLLKEDYPKDIDLILCRNVLIYFVEQAKDEIYERFSKALVDEGVLFVGSSEQIVNSREFSLEAIKTYFYKKKK